MQEAKGTLNNCPGFPNMFYHRTICLLALFAMCHVVHTKVESSLWAHLYITCKCVDLLVCLSTSCCLKSCLIFSNDTNKTAPTHTTDVTGSVKRYVVEICGAMHTRMRTRLVEIPRLSWRACFLFSISQVWMNPKCIPELPISNWHVFNTTTIWKSRFGCQIISAAFNFNQLSERGTKTSFFCL